MLHSGDISFSPMAWFFFSGKSFFAGMLLLILSAVLSCFLKNRCFSYLLYSLGIAGLFFILLSATPLYPLLWILWLTALALSLIKPGKQWFRFVPFLIFSCLLLFLEWPYHRPFTIPLLGIQKIYVIGDSVSAGMGSPDEKTWPDLFSQKSGIPVVNLSMAGATVKTAVQKQVPKISDKNSLVIIEIGGNDLLGHTSPEEFESLARDLFSQLDKTKSVVWMELPLLVHHYPYGRIQRKLAREYHVPLIPKSVLSHVFGTEGATSDGIHLTSKGHELMAEEMMKIIQTE